MKHSELVKALLPLTRIIEKKTEKRHFRFPEHFAEREVESAKAGILSRRWGHKLDPSTAGFEGRDIFYIYERISHARWLKKHIVTCDFSGAFDSVSIEAVQQYMRELKIPPSLLQNIFSLKGKKHRQRHIYQGFSRSTFLFAICTSRIARRVRRILPNAEIYIYIDDVTIVVDTEEQAHRALKIFIKEMNRENKLRGTHLQLSCKAHKAPRVTLPNEDLSTLGMVFSPDGSMKPSENINPSFYTESVFSVYSNLHKVFPPMLENNAYTENFAKAIDSSHRKTLESGLYNQHIENEPLRKLKEVCSDWISCSFGTNSILNRKLRIRLNHIQPFCHLDGNQRFLINHQNRSTIFIENCNKAVETGEDPGTYTWVPHTFSESEFFARCDLYAEILKSSIPFFEKKTSDEDFEVDSDTMYYCQGLSSKEYKEILKKKSMQILALDLQASLITFCPLDLSSNIFRGCKGVIQNRDELEFLRMTYFQEMKFIQKLDLPAFPKINIDHFPVKKELVRKLLRGLATYRLLKIIYGRMIPRLDDFLLMELGRFVQPYKWISHIAFLVTIHGCYRQTTRTQFRGEISRLLKLMGSGAII